MNRRNPDLASATAVGRPQRTPVGMRSKMSVFGKDANFEYRWVNDTPGNIDAYLEGGWEFVPTKEVKVGHTRVDRASEEGTNVSQVVNSSDGLRAFLLKIKKEWYEEDQARHQQLVDEHEGSLSQNGGDYGKITISRN